MVGDGWDKYHDGDILERGSPTETGMVVPVQGGGSAPRGHDAVQSRSM